MTEGFRYPNSLHQMDEAAMQALMHFMHVHQTDSASVVVNYSGPGGWRMRSTRRWGKATSVDAPNVTIDLPEALFGSAEEVRAYVYKVIDDLPR